MTELLARWVQSAAGSSFVRSFVRFGIESKIQVEPLINILKNNSETINVI